MYIQALVINVENQQEIFNNLYIDGYGYISVGSQGTIIGKRGKMKPSNNCQKKYYRVHIGDKFYSVHRLVAQAFIPNPNNYPQVNHKDGDKSHNYVENLEWVTDCQNKKHAVKNSLVNSKITYEDSIKIKELYSTGKYTYNELADMFGVSFSNIGYIIRNHTWNANELEESA